MCPGGSSMTINSSDYPKINLTHSLSKIPPNATDLEEVILGAIMLEKETFQLVNDILTDDCFYMEKHRLVYLAITALHERSEVIDIMTVTIELKRMGHLDSVGGPFFVTELTGRVASAANVQYHAMIVKQEWVKRKIIQIGAGLSRDGYDDTIDALTCLQNAQLELDSITSNLTGKRAYTLSELGQEAKIEIFKRINTPNFLPGEETGFKEVDEITLGLMKSDLIVLAARPGMGKTAFAVQVAKYVARDRKKPVVIFSLEMKDKQLVQRIIAGETGINSMAIQRGRLEYDDQKKIESLDIAFDNLIIDDTAAATLTHISSRAFKVRAMMGELGLIVVDYLQLMSGQSKKTEHREAEIASISRGLKQIAKEFNCPVLALSQLSRKSEERKNKMPDLSDLRESGAIEQDADSVWFLWRPSYYKIKGDEVENFEEEDCFVIIAKNRHGALARKKIRFVAKYVKFEDYNIGMPKVEIPFNAGSDDF